MRYPSINLTFTEICFATKIIIMKYGDFHGHKAVVLENEHFRLECLAQAGPRVVRLIPHWTGENIFAELPNLSKKNFCGRI